MNLIFVWLKSLIFKLKENIFFHKKMYLTFYINFIKIGMSLRKIAIFIPKEIETLFPLSWSIYSFKDSW